MHIFRQYVLRYSVKCSAHLLPLLLCSKHIPRTCPQAALCIFGLRVWVVPAGWSNSYRAVTAPALLESVGSCRGLSGSSREHWGLPCLQLVMITRYSYTASCFLSDFHMNYLNQVGEHPFTLPTVAKDLYVGHWKQITGLSHTGTPGTQAALAQAEVSKPWRLGFQGLQVL